MEIFWIVLKCLVILSVCISVTIDLVNTTKTVSKNEELTTEDYFKQLNYKINAILEILFLIIFILCSGLD